MVVPEFKRIVTSKVSLFFCHWKYCIRIAITDPNSPSEKPGFPTAIFRLFLLKFCTAHNSGINSVFMLHKTTGAHQTDFKMRNNNFYIPVVMTK